MNILLTGGAGYIGSHTCVTLQNVGHRVVILDNFCNSDRAVVPAIQTITGVAPTLVDGDVRNIDLVVHTLTQHRIDAVIHFAAHKSVEESLRHPVKYYDNNVGGLVALLQAMDTSQCRQLIYSSSAVVYGTSQKSPLRESSALESRNPYAHTKLIGEDMLAALSKADASWRLAILRYFNPVGAHPSGLIGEHPQGVPNNLMPYVSQAAIGALPFVKIFGDDYATADGTGVRDFVHVMDIAEGHASAISKLESAAGSRQFTVNLGTGQGHSVREVIRAYSVACGKDIPVQVEARRDGDVAECYADVSSAASLLNWKSSRTLNEICADSWRWQKSNPTGFSV